MLGCEVRRAKRAGGRALQRKNGIRDGTEVRKSVLSAFRKLEQVWWVRIRRRAEAREEAGV